MIDEKNARQIFLQTTVMQVNVCECVCVHWRQHDNVVTDNDDRENTGYRIERQQYWQHHVRVHVHVTFYETKDERK